MQRSRLLRAALGAAGLALATASGAAAAQSAGNWADGAAIYRATCHYCHDTGVGPVLKGRALDPAYISARARYGFRAMPAFRHGTLSDDDLARVAQYISSSPAAR
ncbi:MAG TPA: cytochrome c [Gammaproteobacteria bacterium]